VGVPPVFAQKLSKSAYIVTENAVPLKLQVGVTVGVSVGVFVFVGVILGVRLIVGVGVGVIHVTVHAEYIGNIPAFAKLGLKQICRLAVIPEI
jgi:hypothetical protein